MRNRKSISVSLASVLMVCLLGAAAPGARADDPEDGASTVGFRITRFDPGDAPPPRFRAGGADGGAVEFEVPLTHIAGPYEAPLRDGAVLDLWRDGGESPELSVRIDPAEREHLLLVFLPRDDGFQVMKIQMPPNRVRGGDRLIVNAVPDALVFRLGGMEPLLVPAGEVRVLRGPPGDEITSQPVEVHRRAGEGWELASSEQWPCDPRFRRILFAHICPRSHHLAFHGVIERVDSP